MALNGATLQQLTVHNTGAYCIAKNVFHCNAMEKMCYIPYLLWSIGILRQLLMKMENLEISKFFTSNIETSDTVRYQ